MITYTDDIVVWTVRAGTIGLHRLGKLHTQGTTVPEATSTTVHIFCHL